MTDLFIQVAGAALLLAAVWLLVRSLSKDARRSVDALTDEVSSEQAGLEAEKQPSSPAPPEPSDAELEVAFAESSLERPDSFEQFPSSSSSETLDVFIGLDFGTSCSKVVIRSTLHDNRALAVPFGKSSDGGLRYLLPTSLYERHGGVLSIGDEPGATAHTDLKRALMKEKNNPRHRALATGYLALALRKSRIWFIETQHREYGHVRLRWTLNMGIPSAWYDDSELRQTFEAVVHAAWNLSLQPANSLELATKALEEVELDTEMEINVIPEIGAEVVGYLKSPEYRSGLHVIVDVGGGTLDVCGFGMHQLHGENAFELFSANVVNLGAYVLHERRYDAALEQGGAPQVPRAMAHPLSPIPSPSEYVQKDVARFATVLARVDADYRNDCTSAIMKVLKELHDENPNDHHWKTGLPVFFAGGGSRLAVSAESLHAASDRATRVWVGVESFRLRPLAGIRIHRVPAEMLPRLAVAYGLSFDVDDIGRFRNPSEHEKFPRRPVAQPMPEISKDQV